MKAIGGWILSGVRTPFAKAGSVFKRVPSYELGRIAAAEVIARADLDPGRIDEVVFGHCAMPAEAANSSRIVALRAGVPERVPAATVHRNCASGMEAVANACLRIAAGDASLVLTGGMESMSRIPLQYTYEYGDFLEGLMRAKSPLAKLGALARFRPAMLTPRIAIAEGLTDLVCGLNMGQTAEVLSREFHITREQQDAFALQSHQRALAARERQRDFSKHELNDLLRFVARQSNLVDQRLGQVRPRQRLTLHDHCPPKRDLYQRSAANPGTSRRMGEC